MKEIESFPGYYVSEAGEIFSDKGRKRIKLKPRVNTEGYLVVILRRDGKSISKSVHRLTAEAYVPNPDSLPCVLHNDDDKLNPHKDNLRWGTQADNVKDMFNRGRESVGNNKVKVKAVNNQGEVYEFESIKEAAEYFGFKPVNLRCALNRKRMQYKGYTWSVAY